MHSQAVKSRRPEQSSAPTHFPLSPPPPHLGRSFYLIRTKPGSIAYEELDACLDLGMLGEGPSLRMLEQTLSNVFMPMLMQLTGTDSAAAAGNVLIAAGTDSSHRELLGNMQKFLSQVSHALQQLNGDITLPVSGRLLVCGGGRRGSRGRCSSSTGILRRR